MDGKFTNTEIVNRLDTISNTFKDRLQNPFYNFNAEKGTVVTYYNVDMNNYPLDKVTGMQYSSIGPLSNTKYNKIEKFVLYGIDRIAVTINDTEDGTEADEISGTALLLPNTIHPYAGDFFTIDYQKEKMLYRIIDAQSDTFDDGANVWELNYKIEHTTDEEINKYNIGMESTFLLNNVGTQYTSVIENNKLLVIDRLEETRKDMEKYYKKLFYNQYVQCLIFKNGLCNFYDSFLTEFIIKNRLLSGKENYIFLDHKLSLPDTFEIDYDRSFFKCIEDRSSKRFKISSKLAYGELIDNKTSIFAYRPEQYLFMHYTKDLEHVPQGLVPGKIFDIFDNVLLQKIADKELFEDDILSNMIIKYFNDEMEITEEDLDELDTYEYANNAQQFYYIPIVLFILEYKIKELLAVKSN